ncbi:hypothetical protein T439DRAFT_234381 [Meredithblackwellia eburnea MCA 4105]
MASSNWPPALKTFVNETFSKCTDQNRAAVEIELKAKIHEAFTQSKLWVIDWGSVKLESLNPKKRKIPTFPTNGINSSLSQSNEIDRRADRAKRFKAEAAAAAAHSSPYAGFARTAGRVVQGGVGSMYSPYNGTPEPEGVYDPNVIDWDKETIVGTSTALEKPFLRLTSVPDPKTIRPLPVLEQTLEMLKRKWREGNGDNYNWVCDQFKSVRQDLTVQRIKNDFTCLVYEIHARIALEKGDLGEFNQCQGQLRELYKHKSIKGQKMEFLGYRILYLLYSRNRAELNSMMAQLTPTEKADESVSHALNVRQAMAQGNYTRVFRLFLSAPKMGAYIMDHFISRERVLAILMMTKAYKQGFPLSLVQSQLAFDTPEEAELFLAKYSANVFKDPNATDLKAKIILSDAVSKNLSDALATFTKGDVKSQV